MLLSPYKDIDIDTIISLSWWIRTANNESLLHLAVVWFAEHSDSRFMKLLLDLGFSPTDEDSAGDIPPFALTLCDSDEEFNLGLKLLIDHDFNINHVTSNGNSLINFAAGVNFTPYWANLLLTLGAKPNKDFY